MAKYKIPELRYRASRICRVLGNPTAYEILHLLKRDKRTPDQLAKILGKSIPTISQVLRSLRNLDLVRYEVKWRERIYWLKFNTITETTNELENLVKRIRKQE
jgi:DNA-binding transcriptional ArsR family regulator